MSILKRVSGIRRASFDCGMSADKGKLLTGMSAFLAQLNKREAANPQSFKVN